MLQIMAKHLSFFLLILGAGLFAVNAFGGQPLQRFKFSEPHMGTTVRIVLYAPDEATAKKAAHAAFARIAELNKILSDYDPDSELMRLCKKAGGPPVPVSLDLFHVLQTSEKYARLSDGAFDISISPVVRLWRKARRTQELPKADAIKKALALVDYRKIKLDAGCAYSQIVGIQSGGDKRIEAGIQFQFSPPTCDASGNLVVGAFVVIHRTLQQKLGLLLRCFVIQTCDLML